MAEVLEGDIAFHRHADGRVEITRAPARTRISLELWRSADPHLFRVSGSRITLAGQVTYEVVGWDALSHALIADKREG